MSECCICFTEFQTSKKIVLECTHEFCIDCVKQFRDPSCPCCRAPITESSFICNGVDTEVLNSMNEKKREDKQEREALPPGFQNMDVEGLPPILSELIGRVLQGGVSEGSIDMGPFTVHIRTMPIPQNFNQNSAAAQSSTSQHPLPNFFDEQIRNRMNPQTYEKGKETFEKIMEAYKYLINEIRKNPVDRDMEKDIQTIVNAVRMVCIVKEFDMDYSGSNSLLARIFARDLPGIYTQYSNDFIRDKVLTILTNSLEQ